MTVTSAEEKLAGIRAGLNADGYEMVVSEEGPTLVVEIVASPASCADCLIPQRIMEEMLRTQLGDDAPVIELRYPDTAGH